MLYFQLVIYKKIFYILQVENALFYQNLKVALKKAGGFLVFVIL